MYLFLPTFRNLGKVHYPMIRRWAMYHRQVVAKEAFKLVDTKIWGMLWKWALHRHSNKGKRWVKDKYFKRYKGSNWTFLAPNLRGGGDNTFSCN